MHSNLTDLVRQLQGEALDLGHYWIPPRQELQGSLQKRPAYLGDGAFAQPENMRKSPSALCARMWI